jgi:predicted ArsR family transcriptional regulator
MTTRCSGEGRSLERLGEAFGDATRRALYERLLEAKEPLSAGDLGRQFGIHRTVARSHLERLCEAGLVTVTTRRHEHGGRPAKVYALSDERFDLQLPARRYEALAGALLRIVAQLPAAVDVVDLAVATGRAQGREVARSQLGVRKATLTRSRFTAAVTWLNDNGYRAHVERSCRGHLSFTIANCVYREAAEVSPEFVCSYDCAFIRGLTGADDREHKLTASIVAGDKVCRHEFTLSTNSGQDA